MKHRAITQILANVRQNAAAGAGVMPTVLLTACLVRPTGNAVRQLYLFSAETLLLGLKRVGIEDRCSLVGRRYEYDHLLRDRSERHDEDGRERRCERKGRRFAFLCFIAGGHAQKQV